MENRNTAKELSSSCFPVFQINFSSPLIFVSWFLCGSSIGHPCRETKTPRTGSGARREASGSNGLRTLGGSGRAQGNGDHEGSEARSGRFRQRDFERDGARGWQRPPAATPGGRRKLRESECYRCESRGGDGSAGHNRAPFARRAIGFIWSRRQAGFLARDTVPPVSALLSGACRHPHGRRGR